MLFHEILRNLLNERGLTQKQAASDLHIPASTMGGYVQGTSEPDFSTLILFAEYFQVSTDYLLDYRCKNTQSHEEDEMLRIYRTLPEQFQKLYLEQGQTLLKFWRNRNSSKKIDL